MSGNVDIWCYNKPEMFFCGCQILFKSRLLWLLLSELGPPSGKTGC